MSGDLTARVKESLEATGFPLEMRVARAMQRAQFEIVQGDYIEDRDTKKWREIDIVGYSEARSKTCRAIFAAAVECKSAVDKPWVLFTSTDGYPPQLSVWRRATNEQGHSILSVLSLKPEIQDSPLFRLVERPGYGLTTAFRKGSDVELTHEAVHSVCKATVGLLQRLGDVPNENIVPLVWPVLVTAAPLFECFLNEDDELVVSEIKKGSLVWRNPIVTRHTIVQIYTAEAFLKDMTTLKAASREICIAIGNENDRHPREKKPPSE